MKLQRHRRDTPAVTHPFPRGDAFGAFGIDATRISYNAFLLDPSREDAHMDLWCDEKLATGFTPDEHARMPHTHDKAREGVNVLEVGVPFSSVRARCTCAHDVACIHHLNFASRAHRTVWSPLASSLADRHSAFGVGHAGLSRLARQDLRLPGNNWRV